MLSLGWLTPSTSPLVPLTFLVGAILGGSEGTATGIFEVEAGRERVSLGSVRTREKQRDESGGGGGEDTSSNHERRWEEMHADRRSCRSKRGYAREAAGG